MKKILSLVLALTVVLSLAAGVTASAEGDTIKIGTSYAMSGGNAAIGENILRGIDFAVEEINAKGGVNGKMLEVVRGDHAGDPAQVEALFQKISRLDVLVNNAGISYVGLLHEMSPEEWRRVLSTNLDSCFYTSRYAIPLMLQNHAGRIINISSVWGNVGSSMEVAYSASKGGINAYTKSLAKELAPSNIQVNAIACGVIDTSMNACFSAEDMEALVAEIPADRIGDPSEVAALALQLATAPSYLTGQIITMDGGWT